MKLLEVVRPSDKAAERAKQAAKEEAFKKRVVNAYTRALTANGIFEPHQVDVEAWLFGGSTNQEELINLIRWTDAIGHFVDARPNDKESSNRELDFRKLSHYLDIDHEFVDFVCGGGKLPEEK